jgi:hypothetical protein
MQGTTQKTGENTSKSKPAEQEGKQQQQHCPPATHEMSEEMSGVP